MTLATWLDNYHNQEKLKSAQAKTNPDKPGNLARKVSYTSFHLLCLEVKKNKKVKEVVKIQWISTRRKQVSFLYFFLLPSKSEVTLFGSI